MFPHRLKGAKLKIEIYLETTMVRKVTSGGQLFKNPQAVASSLLFWFIAIPLHCSSTGVHTLNWIGDM